MSQVAAPRPVLAVFGGSFNPPHLGHALLPRYLLARGLADQVLIAPCWSHALGKSLAPFARRMAYADACFAQDGDRVWVSSIEAELAAQDDKPSYALRLLEALRDRYPGFAVRLVVGSDITSTGETDRWHRWDLIERDFSPIVVPRAGYEGSSVSALPELSSTQLRAWLDDPTHHQAQLSSAMSAQVLRLATQPSAGRVCVVGHGNVAGHLRRHLARMDPWFDVQQVGARELLGGLSPEFPDDTRAVLLASKDASLGGLAAALVAAKLPKSVPVLHTAGALRSEFALAPLKDAGYAVGSLHPICALHRECPNSRISSAGWGVEGDRLAKDFALCVAGKAPTLDLSRLDAPGRRRYHAACALIANHVAVLREGGREVLKELEAGPAAKSEAVANELLRSAVDILNALGLPRGVSGPVARGELDVARAHALALGGDAGALYGVLSERLALLLRS